MKKYILLLVTAALVLPGLGNLLNSKTAQALVPQGTANAGLINSIETDSSEVLIAASPQLNNFLYNYTLRTTNNQVRNYKVQLPDYSTAYFTAQGNFNNLTDSSTYRLIPGTNGLFPSASLIGGGSANLRNSGNYSPWPTIDLYNHNTAALNGQSFSQVREVKFLYRSNMCSVSSFASTMC